MNILIFGSKSDGFTTKVISEINRRNINSVHLIDCDNSLDLSIRLRNKSDQFEIFLDGNALPKPSVYWSRIKVRPEVPEIVTNDHYSSSMQERYLRYSEWCSIANGLECHFQDISVQNPSASQSMSPKLSQQLLAVEAGFSIYDSHVVMGKREAMSFASTHPEFVIKAVGFPVLVKDGGEDPGLLVTTALTKDITEQAEEAAFTFVPTWMQEKAQTGREHRIIAIGKHVFSYEVQDEVSKRVHADSRLLRPGFKLVNTSAKVSELCQRFLSLSGLSYGVFDLIIEDSSDIKFLECNPEGQWHSANNLNFEEVVSAFVDLLLAKGKGQSHS